jgi:hypothetical protein
LPIYCILDAGHILVGGVVNTANITTAQCLTHYYISNAFAHTPAVEFCVFISATAIALIHYSTTVNHNGSQGMAVKLLYRIRGGLKVGLGSSGQSARVGCWLKLCVFEYAIGVATSHIVVANMVPVKVAVLRYNRACKQGQYQYKFIHLSIPIIVELSVEPR